MSGAESPHKTLHLAIRGRVQGVFFRDSMRIEAQKLGVTGWVRNCSDGSVEAVVHGPASAVEAIVQWAHRGPPQAGVQQVVAEPAEGFFAGFEVLRNR